MLDRAYLKFRYSKTLKTPLQNGPPVAASKRPELRWLKLQISIPMVIFHRQSDVERLAV